MQANICIYNGNYNYKDEKFLDAPHFEVNSQIPESLQVKLEYGDEGEAVKSLQEKLIKIGYKLVADGDFGNNTKKAIIDFQSKNGLVADDLARGKVKKDKEAMKEYAKFGGKFTKAQNGKKAQFNSEKEALDAVKETYCVDDNGDDISEQ